MQMRTAFRWGVVIGVMIFGIISGTLNPALAQNDSAPQASPDLASRIDSLEKQMADLRSQMEAQKAAAAMSAPTPAPAAAVSGTTPAAAPAPTDLPACWVQPLSAVLSTSITATIRISPRIEPPHWQRRREFQPVCLEHA